MNLLFIYTNNIIISGEEQCPLKLGSNFEDIFNIRNLIVHLTYEHFIINPKALQQMRQNLFLCPRLTGALLDRLTHKAHILEMNGESYRLSKSLMKKNIIGADRQK